MGTLFTALGAATALAGTDIIPVHQGGARAVGLTGAQLLTYVGTTYVPLAGGTMTGALTIASGTLTASAPALSITQTWNNSGVTFTGLKLNVTNTASDSASLLQDWQVNGSSVSALFTNGTFLTTTGSVLCYAARVSHAFYWDTGDLALYRDAAGILAQRNGTNAQTLRVYSTYTDSSNFERLTLSTTAGTSVNIVAETLGTGGDNLDIVLTPAGTGAVQAKSGLIAGASTLESAALAYGGEYGMRMFSSAALRWTAGNISAGADTAMRRSAAGIVAIDNGTAGTYRDLIVRNVKTDPVAFASLVAAATAGNGARAMITNCSHATFGTAADGGGSTKVPVYSDGASWLVG